MKVIEAIKKYSKTDKRLFLQPLNDTGVYVVRKDKNPYFELGNTIVNAEVHHIDELESPDAVTIYIS